NLFGGCTEPVRNGHNALARFHICCHECKPQRVRSAVDADAIFCIAELCKFPLEVLDHRPPDETRVAEGLLNHLHELRLQLLVRCHEIKKWDLRCARHFGYCFSCFRYRKTLAGFPATMAFAGTSLVTTLPSPTIAF